MIKIKKRNPELIYSVNDKPPLTALLLQPMQHVFILTAGFIFPVIIAQQLDIGFIGVRNFLSLSILACGIGVILQGLGKFKVGSGYFIVNTPAPTYITVMLSAGWIGGLPLIYGMTIFAGIVQIFLSRVFKYIGFLFPTVVIGIVVTMVGISLVPIGFCKITGVEMAGDSIALNDLIVGLLTLFIILAANLQKGFLKQYCVLIGIITGYILSCLFGLLESVNINNFYNSELFALPFF